MDNKTMLLAFFNGLLAYTRAFVDYLMQGRPLSQLFDFYSPHISQFWLVLANGHPPCQELEPTLIASTALDLNPSHPGTYLLLSRRFIDLKDFKNARPDMPPWLDSCLQRIRGSRVGGSADGRSPTLYPAKTG